MKRIILHGLNWVTVVSDAEKGNLAPTITLLRAKYLPPLPEPPSKESWPLWQGMLAAEREGRSALAALLSRRQATLEKNLRDKRRTQLFNLSKEERYKRAERLVERLQAGTATLFWDDVRKMIPPGHRIKIKDWE